MQIKYLHKSVYKLYNYSCKQFLLSDQLEKRKKCLGDWELLKARKLPESEISKITGVSRATYYRRKRSLRIYGFRGLQNKSTRPQKVRQSAILKSTIDLIFSLRKKNPTYGKAKITVILKRDYKIALSESSVGRILTSFVKKGLLLKSRSAIRKRRKRVFNKHAKPWHYNIKAKTPGQLVQIDHMVVTKNNIHFKHFQAWDPCTKILVAEVYSEATSSAAAKFLLKVIRELPFPLRSVQVDGGSEFMAKFEQACADNNIELFVLPPKRPQYNGGVERANRTLREEFYQLPNDLDSIGAVRNALNNAILKYNHYRPHHSLHGLTPAEYTNSFLTSHSLQSHM